MVVYIVQSDEAIYLGELQNVYVTTSKEKAKQYLKDEITDNIIDDITEEIEKDIQTFAEDLVDGKTENHYSNEFEGVCVWCEVHTVDE